MRTLNVEPVFESLENRNLFSVAPITYATSSVAGVQGPVHGVHVAAAARSVASTQNILVSFYGLGGSGFANSWVARIADAAGAQAGYAVRKYQETAGGTALKSLFASIDRNRDHALSAAEIANAHVRVLGYSYGAIQGINFTRALASGGQTVLGYQLAAAIPVEALVCIDPVNYTPSKHTDGVLGNVQRFTSYYELNPGDSAIHLVNKKTGASAGNAHFSYFLNPIGDPVSSNAQHSEQILVDFGDWASRSVTQYYSSKYTGTMKGSEVNHLTITWYLYSDALLALEQ